MMSFSEKYKERSKYLCKYQVKVEEFIKRYKIEHEAESAFQIDL